MSESQERPQPCDGDCEDEESMNEDELLHDNLVDVIFPSASVAPQNVETEMQLETPRVMRGEPE